MKPGEKSGPGRDVDASGLVPDHARARPAAPVELFGQLQLLILRGLSRARVGRRRRPRASTGLFHVVVIIVVRVAAEARGKEEVGGVERDVGQKLRGRRWVGVECRRDEVRRRGR